jgi:hypothetical protein
VKIDEKKVKKLEVVNEFLSTLNSEFYIKIIVDNLDSFINLDKDSEKEINTKLNNIIKSLEDFPMKHREKL